MNLIFTCARHMERDAIEEMTGILETMGDNSPAMSITDMSGIITADTTINPVTVSNGIREMLIDEPWTVRYCMRVIPIQRTTRTELEAIADAAVELSGQMPKDATYKIIVERRNTKLSSKEIISAIADHIRNKVSLEHPDRIILIEILEEITGVSMLQSTDIFSAEKTRRRDIDK